MVKDNDIYYRLSHDARQVQQVTDDGVAGVLFNGVSDWLYRGQ